MVSLLSLAKVNLYYHKSIPHLNQIFTGFKMLSDEGAIRLNVVKTNKTVYEDRNIPVVRVNINDKTEIIYDTLDGYSFNSSYALEENLQVLDKVLGNCDYYFKRSFSPKFNISLRNQNIYPLGLNYKVHNELYDELFRQSFLSKAYLKEAVSRFKYLSFVFHQGFYKDIKVANFQALPLLKENYFYDRSIIFLTRAWDPQEVKGVASIEERNQINSFRAACIRACRNEFGKYFLGGFEATEFDRKQYPDLVVSNRISGKSSFIRHLKAASICIATTGLHKSIGWKMGEYVANSKAIISEPLHYALPGGFSEGKNYMVFDSVDVLIKKLYQLKEHQELIMNMMLHNYRYYLNWLRPDSMILNTLVQAFCSHEQTQLSVPC